MAYEIRLTAQEYETLLWLDVRGYAGDLLDVADSLLGDCEVILRLSEPSAWVIRDRVESDPHAWLTCCGDEGLAEKLNAFLNRIV